MSGRSKGFDPLSNLFSDAAASSTAGDSRPADAQTAENGPSPVSDPAAVVRSAALADPSAPPEAPPAVDKVALARKLAAQAQAKAKANAAQEAPVDKAALARKLAADAQARVAAEKSAKEKAELAKSLAKAAMAKNSAKTPTPAPAKAKRSLADRAGGGRRMSALEAARAAAAEEAARKEETVRREPAATAPPAPSTAPSTGGLTGGVLGSAVHEEAPRIAQQRELLTALWKSHTHRLAEDGRWNEAGSCAAVVDALDRLGPGQLAAVPARAGSDDLLVWVDLTRRSVIAVIPDGRAYLTGL
jgi:hypothetical protein